MGPFLLHGLRHLGHVRRRGAGADGVGEDVHLGKSALADEGQRLGELFLRLLRKAGDHISGDGRMLKILIQKRHGLCEAGRIILSVHALQRGVTAALHGQMELGAQVRQGGGTAAEVLRNGPGLQAAQPDTDAGGGGTDGLHQVDEGLAGFQVFAPGGNLNTCQNDLPVAVGGQARRLLRRLIQGERADRTAGVGDDAVGAEIDAAVLHLQHGPGPLAHAAGRQHLEHPAFKGLVDGLQMAFLRHRLLQKADEAGAVAGTGDQVHIQLPHIVRMGLGVAAADGHHSFRTLLFHPVDDLPGFLVADRRDGAGIHHIGVRSVGKVHHLMASGPEGLLHGLGLILIHLTSKGVNGNFHGFSLHFSRLFYIIMSTD